MVYKVVHLITLLELGGAQGNTIYTVLNLNEKRFSAQLWAGKGAYWDEEVKKSLGISKRLRFIPFLARSINPFFDFISLFYLWRLLKKEKPLILHTHSSKAGILGRIAARWAGIPIIIHTFHGFGFNHQQKPWTRKLFILLEKWVAKWTDKLIFVSEANLEEAKSLQIGLPKQYNLIRSGVSLTHLKTMSLSTNAAQLRRDLRIPNQNKIVVTIGPFKPQKNLQDFIKIAQNICKTAPDIHFLVIGDGDLRGFLENQIIESGLIGKVHLPGWRRDISQILSISDVFAMTSLWEGLPRSLVEALALGIPSVCYETDGVTDLLKNGGGFLIKQRDIETATLSIKRLLNEGTLWAQKSKEAKALITQEFDIKTMVTQQEKLYDGLIN